MSKFGPFRAARGLLIPFLLVAAGLGPAPSLAAGFPFERYFDPALQGIQQGLQGLFRGTPAPYTTARNPTGGRGEVVNGVNLFTGQPSYSIPLGSISARGQVAYPFSLSYAGPVEPLVRGNNRDAFSAFVGMGWGFEAPFVQTVHQGTYNYDDDIFFCNLGPFGGGQLFQNSAGRFYLESNPYITIRTFTQTSSTPLYNQIEGWEFQLPGGIKLSFGNRDGIVSNSERFQPTHGLRVPSPLITRSSATPFIYRWDISSASDPLGTNKLDFVYSKNDENSEGYTRESLLEKVQVKDAQGNEIERMAFAYGVLDTSEYYGRKDYEPRDFQRFFITRFLKQVSHFSEGREDSRIVLDNDPDLNSNARQRLPSGVKKRLCGVKFYVPVPTPSLDMSSAPFQETGRFEFGYDADHNLTSVRSPDKSTFEFVYGPETLTRPAAAAAYSTMTYNGATSTFPVTIPNDAAPWRNDLNCDERFCYLIVKDGSRADKTFLHIIENRGIYFNPKPVFSEYFDLPTSLQADNADSWQVTPQGDYFILVDQYGSKVRIFTFNGQAFVKTAELSFPGKTGKDHGIRVYPMQDAMVVEKIGTDAGSDVRKIYVATREPRSDTWSLVDGDTETTESCEIDNQVAFPGEGQGVRPSGSNQCMVFSGKIQVSASANMFTVVHDQQDVIFAYTRSPLLRGFRNITDGFRCLDNNASTCSPSVQFNNHWNNWQDDVISVQHGRNFMVVKIRSDDGKKVRFDILQYDGKIFRRVGGQSYVSVPSGEPDISVRILGSRLLSWNHEAEGSDEGLFGTAGKRKVKLWQPVLSGQGLEFSPVVVRGDLLPADQMDLVVNAGQDAFSLEYYPEGSAFPKDRPAIAVPNRAPLTEGGEYRTYLYQVDRNEVNDLGAAFRGDRWNDLSDFQFSPTTGLSTVRELRKSDGTPCTDSSNCLFRYHSAFYMPLKGPPHGLFGPHPDFIDPMAISLPITSNGSLSRVSVSTSSRIGGISYRDPGTGEIRFKLFAFKGKGYGELSEFPVIKETKMSSGLGTDEKNVKKNTYNYTPQSQNSWGHKYFEHTSGLPYFGFASVATPGRGMVTYNFHVDDSVVQTPAEQRSLIGKVFSIETTGEYPNGFSIQSREYDKTAYTRGFTPAGAAIAGVSNPWPKEIREHRLKAVMNWKGITCCVTVRSANDTVEYFQYNDTTGTPRFSLSSTFDGNHTLSHQFFNELGLTTQSLSYRLANRPTNLATVDAKVPYPLTAQDKLIGASRQSFTGYLPRKKESWRDIDEGQFKHNRDAASDQALKQGLIPTFNLSENWITTSQVLQRNGFGQILEASMPRAEEAGIVGYTSTFYEGRASFPVATVANSPRHRTAVLLAEQGPGQAVSPDGRWSMNTATTSFTSERKNTGRYSFKVVNGGGPVLEMVPGILDDSFKLIVSGWVYAAGAVPVKLKVRMFNSTGGEKPALEYTTPVQGGVIAQNRWQRWERIITAGELKREGLFSLQGDYLNIGFETASGTFYLDDIVVRPYDSRFSLTTYNEKGQPSSRTDTFHKVSRMVYGYKNNLVGIRDEKDRLFSASALHQMGENQ